MLVKYRKSQVRMQRKHAAPLLKPNTTSPHHPSRSITSQADGFTWPEHLRIKPSLKKVVLSKKVINVWLITDSILRHIDEFDANVDKYRINFYRVDKTDSSQLKDLKLLNKIAKEKPHFLYLHGVG